MIPIQDKCAAGSACGRSARRLAVMLTGAAFVGLSTLCAAQKVTVIQETIFSYTGTAQTWKVPAGVHSLTIDLYGGQGGTAPGLPAYYSPLPGGLGGHVTASIAVKPGQVLQINVGGAGTSGGPVPGGGASDVRDGAYTLADRLLVAAGGGGSGGGGTESAIYSGGNSGSAGAGDTGSGLEGYGGGPGTVSAGGSGGAGGTGGNGAGAAGDIGLLGTGGAGGYPDGGAGGDGYYGGGGGGGGGSSYLCVPGFGCFQGTASGGGGGGGSDYASPKAVAVTITDGVQPGNGIVVIHYAAGPGSCKADDGDDHDK